MTTRSTGLGLWLAVASAATFGSSGPFAKSLLVEGWSSGAIVLLRVTGAALVLLGPALFALRGRWHLLARNAGSVLAYGIVSVAGCQVAYFYAVQRLSVGVALMLEYLGVVLVVLWVWLRTRRAPSRLTGVGMGVALLGLALVLDLAGQSRPDLVGVFWGLVAAVGLATYFVIAAEDTGLPPVALAGVGMSAGAVVLGLLGALRVVPMHFADTSVRLLDRSFPWWFAIGELALVAAAAAYLLGVLAARMLGSTVAGFAGLTEVLFAVVFAWLLLGELPAIVQLAGGALIVAGVVAVRVGELRRAAALEAREGPADEADPTVDFPRPVGVA